MLKRKKRQDDEENKDGATKTKVSPAELRLTKDFAELEMPPMATISFPDENSKMKFQVVYDLSKEDCLWKGGKYKFTFDVPAEYPIKPPKAHCDTPIYHPNIDTAGNVCLNILRADWKPVLNVYSVVSGCLYLFIEPNPNDPLNHDAAAVQRDNRPQFEKNVRSSLAGGTINGIKYPKLV